MQILITAIVGFIFLVGMLLELGSIFRFLFVKKEDQLNSIIASVCSALLAFGSGWFAAFEMIGGTPSAYSWLLVILFIVFGANTYRMFSHYLLLKMAGRDKDNYG